MVLALIALFCLAACTMCTPRGAEARAEIRAAAATVGWKAAGTAGRHLLRHTLLLLVEALHVVVQAAAFVGGVIAIAAGRLDTPREAS
ncbi:hypothetical protein ABZW11_17350 [Nonomuraea sp. NPDC004580]|uniref:hypothetical protein n=1 Tax=Nonomuraea sp. NPDC004580 TaxID=3154552 RepID=UPI0033B66A5E